METQPLAETLKQRRNRRIRWEPPKKSEVPLPSTVDACPPREAVDQILVVRLQRPIHGVEDVVHLSASGAGLGQVPRES